MTSSFQTFELLEQLAVTPERIRYLARNTATTETVEVHLFQMHAAAAELWQQCVRRIKQAQLVSEPSLRPIASFDSYSDSPHLVLPMPTWPTLSETLRASGTLDAVVAASLICQLARTLAATQKIGLAHGHLTADVVRLEPSNEASTRRCEIDFVSSLPNKRSPEFADDVRQLGELWMLAAGSSVSSEHNGLRAQMLIDEPLDRPTAEEIADMLTAESKVIEGNGTAVFEAAPSGGTSILSAQEVAESIIQEEQSLSAERAQRTGDLKRTGSGIEKRTAVSKGRQDPGFDPLLNRRTLGRFKLLKKLGEGGMGAVWKAEDPLDGAPVAIKVLKTEIAKNATSLRRFHREARMLSEVQSPYIANLLELNEDDGMQFLVMEFVAGRNALEWLRSVKRLTETQAVAVVADVARALREAHPRGIVHRDLKPENILLVSSDESADATVLPRAKLTDFGLARETEEVESQAVTAAGTVLGTPHYMAPEQCTGKSPVDSRSDVYSLGATLFHFLTGTTPFEAPNVVGLITKQVNEPAPLVRTLVPELSEAIEQLVAKCLAKKPESRYQSALELLADLERLQRGEPTGIRVHPQLPVANPADILAFDFIWELKNSPEKLWPHVSNTERLNRAIGLPPVEYSQTANEHGGSNVFGRFKKMGMTIGWQEQPFEWIEGRRMGVLREYREGPLKWFTSVVELTPRSDGGTTLAHRIRVVAANFVGKTAAKFEVGVKSRKSLQQIYSRIDAALSGELGSLGDPFEDAPQLSSEGQRRLDQRLAAVLARGVEPIVVDRLAEYLASAPPQQLARIRPIALAQKLSVDEKQLIAACLHGAREGLLTMLWDIICPLCRIPSQVKESLKALTEHGNCAACQTDFDLDFANSIELIFRIAPDIQEAETGIFCIAGPAHSPHVVAQVRLQPAETFEMDLSLAVGTYRLRGPQLPYAIDFRVVDDAGVSRWEVDVAKAVTPDLPRILQAGTQFFVLSNTGTHEIVARIERVASRADALTAARAAATPLFRELFPGECLSANQLIHVEQVTLLLTHLDHARQLYFDLGDARAFERIHNHFEKLDEAIRREGGSLVKTLTEGLLAVFTEPLAAVRAALAIQRLEPQGLRLAVHRGPAMVATLNDLLDYFGATVSITEQLLLVACRAAAPSSFVASSTVTADESVAEFLAAQGSRILVGLPLDDTTRIRAQIIEPQA